MDIPLLEVLSTLPRCANGMKGGGPPAPSEQATSRLCAANDCSNTRTDIYTFTATLHRSASYQVLEIFEDCRD